MERTALAFVETVDAAEDLGKKLFWLRAAGEQVAVVSVRGEEIVVRAQAGNRRHAGSLLPDIKMIVAAEHALVVQRHQILFEVTDDEHPPALVEQIFAW